MPYKDRDKQRKAVREAARKHRARLKRERQRIVQNKELMQKLRRDFPSVAKFIERKQKKRR